MAGCTGDLGGAPGRKAWKSLKVHCTASPGQEFGFTVYFLSGWAFVSQVHEGFEQLAVTSLLPQGWNLYLPSHLAGPEFSYYYEGGMSGDQRATCGSQFFSSTMWIPGANRTWPQGLLLLNHLTQPLLVFFIPPPTHVFIF